MNLNRIITTVILLAFSTGSGAHSGATGIVKERMDYFKESKASMKRLKKAIRSHDFETITREAKALNQWATKLADYFPKGSNPHPSEALDLIWQEFDQFKIRAEAQIKASAQLQQAGLEQNSNAASKAFSQLGQSCKGCHNDYRE